MILKKILQYILLSVAGFFPATGNSFGQNYSISPNDSVEISGVFEDLQTLIVNQINTSNDTLHLQWEKIDENIPLLWEASVCDNSFCYSTLEESGYMDPVLPGEYGFLLLHITPHVNFGTSVIRYAVWDTNFPLVKDTLTYILKVDSANAIGEAGKGTGVKLYPNPATNFIHLTADWESGFSYSISDLSGKEINIGIASTGSISIPAINFQNGIYQIAITRKSKTTTVLKFMIHH